MKKKTWIYATTAGVLTVALLAWAFAPRPVEVEVATVTKGRFETSIDEDGKTRLRDRYVVSAPLAGLLARITLREGDAVEANAAVATLQPVLSPMQDERTLREQQAQVEVAQAGVGLAAARAEAARVVLQQARNEQRRTEQLATQGFVSPTKLDSDRLAAQAAQKELDAALEARHVADHQLDQARAALGAVRSPGRLGEQGFVLRSPIAGRVLRVAQASESAVAIGTPLVELGDTRALEVVAELLTTDALQARPGSRVLIERWGGPGTLEGRVRHVEPAAFTKVSALGVEEQRVKVLIDLTSPPAQWQALGDGYRVNVRIITRSVEQAVKVPVSAVFPRADAAGGGMAVFVLRGGRAALQPVQIDARNGSEASVREGLSPGEPVIVYPSSAVKDGARVRRRSV
ncbi:efflux RND transporter periplasmic adaptor subunit [Ideonella sp.]|uniref:efflux RND transporter periplasmic adaptor subunit n=1 Tax=Ideonella sp. TaxID=1929293 RepID=UPI002B499540|nr:HlyD family efflux transporter periplasmic adaptor subunit [Ideonella sp.]HJV71566.1 HlyD family efflux transporter periplasmic adaptor subunit [Ideonella sp.]